MKKKCALLLLCCLAVTALAEDGDLAAVDDQGAVLRIHGAGELAVNRVIAEHVSHVIRGHEGIVDGHDLHVVPLLCGAENQTADAAKAVDADSRFLHSERLLFVSNLGSVSFQEKYPVRIGKTDCAIDLLIDYTSILSRAPAEGNR